MSDLAQIRPTQRVSVRELFGIDSDLMVPAFAERDAHVPEIDPVYRFNPDVTLAILAGFSRNRRVMLQGLHGTGKSTHVEQVAARLNWPCVRVNLDGHISRLDLVGKDAIVLKDGLQVTEFQEGIVPWALQRPVALLFDEYDAGRPDVMFVIQRILERDGKFTLLDQNRVIEPHPDFRLFATANTVGLGNLTGMYHGTQVLNHAQIDRWNIVATLNYLSPQEEAAIVLGASGWQTLWRITLPNVKWGLLYGVILCNARAMGEFGAVSVVSGHIRGLTNTMPLHVEILYNEYQFAAAFAVASLLALLALVTLGIKTWIEHRAAHTQHDIHEGQP